MPAMDIRGWLEQLGLGRYADAFGANDIDEATLRNLTAEDLRELGVASLGHRKRILEAISRLGGSQSCPPWRTFNRASPNDGR